MLFFCTLIPFAQTRNLKHTIYNRKKNSYDPHSNIYDPPVKTFKTMRFTYILKHRTAPFLELKLYSQNEKSMKKFINTVFKRLKQAKKMVKITGEYVDTKMNINASIWKRTSEQSTTDCEAHRKGSCNERQD